MTDTDDDLWFQPQWPGSTYRVSAQHLVASTMIMDGHIALAMANYRWQSHPICDPEVCRLRRC
jgi:hypothetical protein